MNNLITGEKVVEEKTKSSRYATVDAGALILLACVMPIAIQEFLVIDPAVIGMVGIPMIILLGFIGSATVVVPVPVLPLVFTGAAILNPIGLVLAAAASITAGMAVLLRARSAGPLVGCTGSRIAAQPASANIESVLMVDRQRWYSLIPYSGHSQPDVRLRRVNSRGGSTRCPQVSGGYVRRQNCAGIGNRVSGAHAWRKTLHYSLITAIAAVK